MYLYSDTTRVTFIDKGQRQTVNVSPENFEGFKKVHPEYVIVETEEIRNFFGLFKPGAINLST